MPRPRFHRLDPERRRELLDAAAAEFAAGGFEGASLNRVLAAAGISKGAFYYYFDDKTDLLATVLHRATEALVEGIELDLDALDRDSFWPQIEAAFQRTIANALRHSWMAGIGRLFYAPPPVSGVDQVVAAEIERAVGWLDRAVRRGRELGAVRGDLPTELVVAMVAGAAEAADRWLATHWEEIVQDGLESTWSGVFDALRRLVEPAGTTAG